MSAGGERLDADAVVLTTGAWTAKLAPWLAEHIRPTGQPVFHLAPADPAPVSAPHLPVFNVDITKTGWYGFPVHDGVLKLANHGVGRPFDPSDTGRGATPAEERALRTFLADAMPSLATAPIARTRICVYGDTADQHFWIAPDPERRGLVVAAGGSGHAFKFAPLLGDLIADATHGQVVPRFRWRPDILGTRGEEPARRQGSE